MTTTTRLSLNAFAALSTPPSTPGPESGTTTFSFDQLPFHVTEMEELREMVADLLSRTPFFDLQLRLKNLLVYLDTIQEREQSPLHFDRLLDELDLMRLSTEETISLLREKFLGKDFKIAPSHDLMACVEPLKRSVVVPIVVKRQLLNSTPLLKILSQINHLTNYFETGEPETKEIGEERDFRHYVDLSISLYKQEGSWTASAQGIFAHQQTQLKKITSIFLKTLLQEEYSALEQPSFARTLRALNSLSPEDPLPLPRSAIDHPLILKTLKSVALAEKNTSPEQRELELEALQNVTLYLNRLLDNLAENGVYTCVFRRLALIRRSMKELLAASLLHSAHTKEEKAFVLGLRKENNPQVLAGALSRFHPIRVPDFLSYIHPKANYPHRRLPLSQDLKGIIEKAFEVKECHADLRSKSKEEEIKPPKTLIEKINTSFLDTTLESMDKVLFKVYFPKKPKK